MKKVISSASRPADNNYVAKRLEAAGDELHEILGEYAYELSPDDMNILSEEELKEIGEVADMLHEAARYLASA